MNMTNIRGYIELMKLRIGFLIAVTTLVGRMAQRRNSDSSEPRCSPR